MTLLLESDVTGWERGTDSPSYRERVKVNDILTIFFIISYNNCVSEECEHLMNLSQRWSNQLHVLGECAHHCILHCMCIELSHAGHAANSICMYVCVHAIKDY